VLRAFFFAATVFAAGCQSSKPPVSPRAAVDDSPLRIRVAHAEARRVDGLVELAELATSNDVHARELALRGLGRTGGEKAMAILERALDDGEPRVVAAAFAAIGISGSIDDKLAWKPPAATIERALASESVAVRVAAAEALGRAGGVEVQGALATCTGDPKIAAVCALALGRHGRRKLALSSDARRALVVAASSESPDVRYAATYALAREHEPAADPAVTLALAGRVVDPQPEIRAAAIAGIGKRKLLADPIARKPVEDSLRDVDWRVAVEAVRALSGADDAGRALVAAALPRRWSELVKGNAAEAHILIEALRLQIGKPITERTQADAIASLATMAKADAALPAITRGWIECLARMAAPASPALIVDSVTTCGLPDHLRLPLLVEVVTQSIGDAATRRAAIRVLLSHDDPRVRAAGLGAIGASWKEGDAARQQTIVMTIVAAVGSKNPIVESAGTDAADSIYDEIGADSPHKATLDAAIAARAKTETDVELSAALYTLIGKRVIAGGADACRAGLTGHPVRVKAAVECLRKLGEAVETPVLAAPPAPPNDVAEVIGHDITWQLATSRGVVEIKLRPDVAPWAVATVVALTKRGFYDGLELHRVVPDFVAQGGDPTQSGYGDPGFMMPAEPSSAADGPGFMQGGVGMADSGPDSAGSQWFVMHSYAPHLDGRYTWIGSVVSGQKSADALQIGDRVERATVVFK
jgi:cyclophilin family peptidyl-prolyl cis-trans isomerase/HEAT repeat protein